MSTDARPTTVFRSLGWNLWVGATALLFGLVAVAIAANGGLAVQIVLGALAAACFVVAVRAVRAGVTVTDRELTVRGLTRTHHLPWDEVATVEDSRHVTREGRCVAIRLRDGRAILARGCSSYSYPKLERIAEAIADARPQPAISGEP
jgi:hypothetical protein